MKKLLTSFAVTLCLAFTAHAQTPVASQGIDPNAAEIKLLSDTVDFGTIEQNSDKVRRAKFKNIGKSPLIISNCQGSCGCTVPTCPKEPVAPGKTGEIEISYDTSRLGAISKTVTINSNAKNGTVMLYVKGMIKPSSAPAAAPAAGGH